MNPVRPFVLKRVATLLLALGLLAFGLASWRLLPVAALPQVEYPVLYVFAGLPGASPDTMASTVAAPLERQLADVQGLEQMQSSNGEGNTEIQLRFSLDRNLDTASADVQAAINAAASDLPRGMPSPPVIYKYNPADRPIVVMAFTSDVLPLSRIDQYVDNMLVRQIRNLPGVSRAFIADEHKQAIRIELNPLALAARSLSPEDVREALARQSLNSPKGKLAGGSTNTAIEANDQLVDADGFRSVVIATRNGAAVHLGDVAEVSDGVENDHIGGWYNGRPAIIVGVQKRSGANAVAAVDAIRASVRKIAEALPPSIRIDIVTDRAEVIRASLHDVERTLAITIGLVVLVIFLFLRHAVATIIPSVTIPLSLLGTVMVMYLLGYTLDNLSLMALTIAVGFVVDDAIVVIENIVRHMEQGKPPVAAAIEGGGQVAFTIVSITLSLVAVFIPIFFMGGVAGRMFREFAATVSIAILLSAAVALSLTPMLCGWLLHPMRTGNGGDRDSGLLARAYDRLFSGYRVSVSWVLRHRLLTLGGFAATLALTIGLYITIPKGFFPSQDNGRLFGSVLGSPDMTFDRMVPLMDRLGELVRADPDVYSVTSYVGGDDNDNVGQIVINLKPRDQRSAPVQEVMARLRETARQMPELHLFMQPEPEIVTDASQGRNEYLYTLVAGDRAELRQWVPRIVAEMKKIPGLLDVSLNSPPSGPSTRVVVNRELAARLGVDLQRIDDTLYDCFGARRVTEIFTDSQQYYAIMQVGRSWQTSPAALDLIHVGLADGRQIPLSALAHFEAGQAPTSVTHTGQFPSEGITFNLDPGVSLGEAVERIHAMERNLGLPPGLQGNFSGAAREFEKGLASQPWLIAATILVVYIVLGILYESFIHPLTILSSLPSAGVGALLALRMAGSNFDVIGLIGIILLLGIVKKNAIMMVDFAITAEKQGMSPEAAILEACLVRFRPIMMTTLAAVFGALPLALGTGAGSELRRPLGIAIVGGLLMSQLLTLYSTPVIHLLLRSLTIRMTKVPVLGRFMRPHANPMARP
ncbi:MAG: MMPL family transporter [Telmatospirillum sp.]|nr:MMPL family transporter [Telmatospirillum sp.]